MKCKLKLQSVMSAFVVSACLLMAIPAMADDGQTFKTSVLEPRAVTLA